MDSVGTCSDCGEPTGIKPYEDEYYPGEYYTLYLSRCCSEEILDSRGKPFKQAELLDLYERQEFESTDPELDLRDYQVPRG